MHSLGVIPSEQSTNSPTLIFTCVNNLAHVYVHCVSWLQVSSPPQTL